MGYQREKEKMLRSYLQTITFLNDRSDEIMYLYDIEEQKIYFSDNVVNRYAVPLKNGVCTAEELLKYVGLRGNSQKIFLNEQDFGKGSDRIRHREYQITNREGKKFIVSSREKLQYDENGDPLWVVGRIMQQDSENKTDVLTGLSNTETLIRDLEDCLNHDQKGFLMVLGIDNFKHINNKYGRGFGNYILKNIAETLESIVEDGLRVYRLDSDKFAVNAVGKTKKEIEQLYAQIQDKILLECTVSSGVVQYEADFEQSVDAIYQHAENALDCAKKNGKNNQEFFSEAAYQEQLDNIEFEDELRTSIINDYEGFSLHYQAQIGTKDFQLNGAEALLRYHSPTRGDVSPAEFIPVLEKTELISVVGEWVLRNALQQCKIWREQYPDFRVSVNFSYIQLRNRIVADHVIHLLEELELPGAALTLEVTESVQLQDYKFFNKIFYKLERFGVGISIDDFGTGYSSLSYLKSIAINEVKIDRCFVSGIQHSAYNYRLLLNMIELAHSADIRVCCEGVETEVELQVLKELNPDLLQGYLFSKPCTAKKLEETYFQQESILYKEKQQQIQELLSMDKSEDTKEKRENIELTKMASIIDGMEEIVYVRDPDSYELLYLNAAGRVNSGAYDYKGRKCYAVLQNRKTPCEFCQKVCTQKDGYFVWELDNLYMKKHFLAKDKMISWAGRNARLTICLDLTENEITSKKVREKLEFEDNIIAATKMLAEEKDKDKAINGVLSMIGDYYDAARAYLFELQENGEFWDNTYEWCASGAISQIDFFQNVPLSLTRRWSESFYKGEALVTEDVELIKESAPEEYEILKAQNVQRMIMSPIWNASELVGFLGVDDPQKHIADPAHIQMVSYFLADRLSKEENKDRLGELLRFRNEDILKNTKIGLWLIRIDPKNGRKQMFADTMMQEIMGVKGKLTPEECYEHWHGRINGGYFHYVDSSVQKMIDSRKLVELQYTWKHPIKGEMIVRCIGKRVADNDGMICLEGYHRSLQEVTQPNFILQESSIMFEYHEKQHSIYFHTSRKDLAGTAEKEEDFPEVWIKNGMVHPHFVETFQRIFENTKNQPELEKEELLLKTREGNYGWFYLSTRDLSKDELDADTMIIILEPASRERAMELEFQKLKDFYHATLSEKAAYMEIDLESRRVLNIGGLWDIYHRYATKEGKDYLEILLDYQIELVHPEDVDQCVKFFDNNFGEQIQNENGFVKKLQYRRLLNGRMQWMEITAHVFKERYMENRYALLYIKNIDAEKRREQQNEIAATRDHLTGIYNRASFESEVERHMMSMESEDSTLLLLDIDNFKEINDRYGHLEGDRVLKQLSDALMSTFRRKDILGRLGGDEFMAFLKNLSKKEIINRRIEELRSAFAKENPYGVTCSIGIAEIQKEGFSYEECLKQADAALYLSKQKGRNTYSYYTELNTDMAESEEI